MQLFINSFLRIKARACLAVLPSILLLGACSTPSRIPDSAVHSPDYMPDAMHSNMPDSGGRMNDVALYALSQADTPYRYGGNSLENGFDCSGFVQYVYLNTLGIKLPRTSTEMSRVGKELDVGQLHPGDLVFFNTKHRPFSHVGIYVGEERFVHAPKSGKAIMVVNMRENYWRSRYNGARRITSPN